MNPGHSRKLSSRAPLTRRTTRGPLDVDDSEVIISPTTPSASSINSSSAMSSTINPFEQQRLVLEEPESEQTIPATILSNEELESRAVLPSDDANEELKDLSFLLDASLYHPLSHINTPVAFRRPLPPTPSLKTSPQQVLVQINQLVSQCDFLAAAHLAGNSLASGIVQSTDHRTLFTFLAIRFSCLELSGNLMLAAQEAKALEDLTSAFYYIEAPQTDDAADADSLRPMPKHIMPFSLRVQAIRLQNIGFNDLRRGVAALYDLALECRDNISSPFTSSEERTLWTQHLDELGIRVANALIEMGDIDCAVRTLAQMKPSSASKFSEWTSRMVLLHVKLGDVVTAKELVKATGLSDGDRVLLHAVLAMADGRFEDAAEALSGTTPEDVDPAFLSLVKQNLAVTHLYLGHIQEAKSILEDLVDQGYSFHSLTLNLATIYDLTSDKSRDLKLALADRIAKQIQPRLLPTTYTNSNFKL